MIPKWRQLNVFAGTVNGNTISDGPPEAPHDIPRLRGVYAATRYIVNEVQDDRPQGVKINVINTIEVIVRRCCVKRISSQRR